MTIDDNHMSVDNNGKGPLSNVDDYDGYIYVCQSMMMTVFNLCPEVFAAVLELDQFLKEEEEERREKEEKVSCPILQRGVDNIHRIRMHL